MLDTIAGITLGLFLLSVAVKGNTKKMIDLAKRDKAFMQWAIAVGILAYLHGIPELRSTVRMLIVLAFVGLGLSKQDSIKENGLKFWQSLGDTVNSGVTGSW